VSPESSVFMGTGLPYLEVGDLSGKLVVLEGTDGVGRSTQISDLRNWLELKGYGVATTGWTRSPLMVKAIDQAKAGHTLNVQTLSLLYAADFADRLEHEVIPALKAGFIVLADRYVYTAFARFKLRGADPDWIRKVFGFALKPQRVLYMKLGIESLIPRVINSENLSRRYWIDRSGEGMDYWESGMDLRLGQDFYDSFVEYQRRMLEEFEAMAREFSFVSVDASGDFATTNRALKEAILPILEP